MSTDDKLRRDIKILLNKDSKSGESAPGATDVLQEENNLKAIQDEYATLFLEQNQVEPTPYLKQMVHKCMPITECKVTALWDHRSGGGDHRAIAEALTITTPAVHTVKQDKLMAAAQKEEKSRKAHGGASGSGQASGKKKDRVETDIFGLQAPSVLNKKEEVNHQKVVDEAALEAKRIEEINEKNRHISEGVNHDLTRSFQRMQALHQGPTIRTKFSKFHVQNIFYEVV